MSKILRIVLSKVIGLMIFLILLVVLNALDVNLYIYRLWVTFLNTNAPLLIIMSLVMMIGEIFFVLVFPINLIAPLFSSTGAILLTMFIFKIFLTIDRMIDTQIFSLFWPVAYLIYPIVFIAVLIGGYVSIFSKLTRSKKSSRKDKEWEEIGDEFRKSFSDLFRKIADSIEKK